MERLQQLNRAIEWMEARLFEKIDAEDVAKAVFLSPYHFQRVFGAVCGVTVGEYLRGRRLTKAGEELHAGAKVLDVALKYGYDSSESFSRAFFRFHGIKPSQAKKGGNIKRMEKIHLEEAQFMDFKVERMPALRLAGFKRHFTGAPFGEERARQEHEFFSSTRAKQWLLIGASVRPEQDICVIANVCGEGYDFYIAYEVNEWTQSALLDAKIAGMDLKGEIEFIQIPPGTYAVFKTARKKYPLPDYCKLRAECEKKCLPPACFRLKDAPELAILHWRTEERYIEIRFPVEQRNSCNFRKILLN